MSSFLRRRATPSDTDGVLDIVRALDAEFVGESEYTRSDLDDEWRKLDLARNVWVVEDGGTLVGYGTVDDAGDPRADGYVHPAHFGRGVGTLLVTSLEDEVRGRGAAFVRNAVLLADEPAQELLRAHGYDEVRRFWAMRIELDAEPPAPSWAVEPLDPAHVEAFHSAYEDAFADHWGHTRRSFEAWRSSHLEGPQYAPELWRVVRDGDEIAAGWFGVWERDGVAEVARLFTRREWRRRGLGEVLLHDAFGLFWRGGRRVVGLGVDATSNTGANRLYERAGMHVHWGAVVFEKRFDA
jgi:ribosomal protein S18 acetylase RimI-like enzyme